MEYEFDKIWERVKRVTGWNRQSQLAAFLDIQAVNISKSKKEGVFREGWILKLAEGYDLNVKWLIHGEGPIYAKSQDQNEPLAKPSPQGREPANRGFMEVRDGDYRYDYGRMARAMDAIALLEEAFEGTGYRLADDRKGRLLDAIAYALETPHQRRQKAKRNPGQTVTGDHNTTVGGDMNTIKEEGNGGDGTGDK